MEDSLMLENSASGNSMIDETMKDIEYILDFTVNLGKQMLSVGANLERVDDTMNRILVSYGLEDICIHSLTKFISISARSTKDGYASRQISVPAMNIHLERLNRYNQLSRRVCSEKPDPYRLRDLLVEAEQVKEYPKWLILFGRLIAMASICGLNGGTLMDMVASDIIIFILFWMIELLAKPNLNTMIVNMVCMFFAGSAASFLMWLGIGDNYFIILITCGMLLVPGIPMVNAARNLLCGNEMNGIMEMLKAVIETVSIVFGLIVSIYVFGVG